MICKNRTISVRLICFLIIVSFSKDYLCLLKAHENKKKVLLFMGMDMLNNGQISN